ncbi:MAG TPA: hypothetical protein VFZ73_03840 [Gemmatimonadaceae bacterium]
MSDITPRVSVVVVADGSSSLDQLYREYSAPLREAGISHEFVFVLSIDRGYALGSLLELQAAGEPVSVLESAQYIGEAALLRSTLPSCRGSIIISLTQDPRVAPEALPILIDGIDQGADLVSARRNDDDESSAYRLQRRVSHGIIRRLVGGTFHDLGSGVRAFRREVLSELPLYGEFSRFLPLFAARDGFLVEEKMVPRHPSSGRSRFYSPGTYARRFNDLLAVFFIIRFREKPLRFFGLVGGLTSLVGFLLLLMLGIQRLGGHPLADRPMLVVAVLLFVLGIQSIALGLIGEIIVHTSSRRRAVYRIAPPRSR